MDTDVLIVGAGPTGLMLANQLGRRGVRATIIDRHSGPAQQTRAMGVQARTLEIYSHLGIADEAIAAGAVTEAVNLWSGGAHKARIPVGEAGQGQSPYPFVLMLGQDENERILGARLAEWGIGIRWNTELLALVQQPGQVVATLKDPDGSTREITAAWVAGCDGSRSAVRELCGIGFPGAPYEHVFFVADTEASGDMIPRELNVYLWREGFHLFFPMRGHDRWRVIGILPEDLRGRQDVTFADVAPRIQGEAGRHLAFSGCHWFSTYRIAHRHAERFRDGRCFLLGDAAHVHSPMGAQGMNTGLQDAYNLAWKLAMVVRGEAAPALLDTYEAERLPVAETLLRGTDRAFGMVVADTALAALFRTRIMGNLASVAMRFDRVRRRMFRLISQTGIRYRRSPLSLALDPQDGPGPKAGDRFPWLRVEAESRGRRGTLADALGDLGFHLVVVGQPVAPGTAALPLNTILVDDSPANRQELARAGIAGPRCFVVRPDGYIGLASSVADPQAVTRYLAERIGVTSSGMKAHGPPARAAAAR